MMVNGKSVSVEDLKSPDLFALIEKLGLKPGSVAVERNGAIVPRNEWQSVRLAEDDKLELIRFVGGG